MEMELCMDGGCPQVCAPQQPPAGPEAPAQTLHWVKWKRQGVEEHQCSGRAVWFWVCGYWL